MNKEPDRNIEKKPSIKERLLLQIRQGASPERLAASLAAGVLIGLFPVLFVTTVLGVFVGFLFRLNHPALQLGNYAISPGQLPLAVVLIKAGDWLYGAQSISYDINAIKMSITNDALGFVLTAGLHAITVWAVAAVPVGLMLYFVFRRLLRQMLDREPAAR